MPSDEALKEADRQLTVCNACRYCEGYCAVFPAMEARRTFATEDLIYMANLCFECRACFYACQFAPPHEYGINIPEALSQLRLETYRDYTGQRVVSKLLQGNGRVVALAVAACIAIVLGLTIAVQGTSVVFDKHTRTGAFFEVIPYLAMVIPALALSGYWLFALGIGGWRFWRETGGSPREMLDIGAFWRATKDAFGMHYLKGGNAGGCNYPDEHFSNSRRWYHHLVFYGILSDFVSTTIAAIYHNFLDKQPPYDWLSLPVIFGTVGGVMIIIGALGLLWLKATSDKEPANESMLNVDLIFLALLLLVSISGIVLLAGRTTAGMGTLLTVHLAMVAALFLTLPYGKFAHVVYRYAALMKYQIESAREHAA